tara:strand:- start:699 stop:1061 length:363 start_codon:yes stop_codon:yes gene_type:complete
MAGKNRRKGDYHERQITKWLQEIGIKAKRQPLSGSLGGEYSGDIVINIGKNRLVAEVKYRDKSNFPNPFTVIRDMLIYKRKVGTPKTIIMFDGDVFEKVIIPLIKENQNGNKKRTHNNRD